MCVNSSLNQNNEPSAIYAAATASDGHHVLAGQENGNFVAFKMDTADGNVRWMWKASVQTLSHFMTQVFGSCLSLH